nr:M20/M25/M40 family metallo-hydrolase [Lysinibacillus timonensis]
MSLSSMENTLKQLCNLLALSGYEDSVINYITQICSQKNVEYEVDPLGNVIVQLNKKKDAKRLVVFAHMDELGLVVTKVEDDGFLKVERLGGIPEKSLAGTEIVIQTETGTYQGVIGTKSHHVTPQDEKLKVKTVNEIYIDLGFSSKSEVLEAGIHAGTPVGYSRRFFTNGTRVFSNTLDNRAGCLTLLELMNRIDTDKLEIELYIVFSVQEEFNLRGVLPAIRKINPDFGITIDISIASDTPDLKGRDDIQIGNGPCIGYYTFHGRGTLGGVIPNPKYVKFIEEVAKTSQISLQRYASMGILTDASFSQLENNGFPIIDLGFPTRYSHAPIESIDLADIDSLVNLLVAISESLNQDCHFTRG